MFANSCALLMFLNFLNKSKLNPTDSINFIIWKSHRAKTSKNLIYHMREDGNDGLVCIFVSTVNRSDYISAGLFVVPW